MSDGLPHDLSSELPSPRQDEPASLRQDILDELADHLACSLQRERVKTVSEQQARNNVLNRFGNPASIARKLWFDAMREKIMTQRLTMALMCVMFLVVSGVAVMMWKSLEASQATQAALLERQQEFFSSLLTKMQDQKPDEKVPDGWSKLKVALKSSTGDPVSGTVSVTASSAAQSGRLFESMQQEVGGITRETNAEGIADLGMLKWGSYAVRVQLPSLKISSLHLFQLRPGENSPLHIVCPTEIPVSKLDCQIEIPAALQALPAYFLVYAESSLSYQENSWQFNGKRQQKLLMNSSGMILGEIKKFEGREDPSNQILEMVDLVWTEAAMPQLAGNRIQFRLDPLVLVPVDGSEISLQQPDRSEDGNLRTRFLAKRTGNIPQSQSIEWSAGKVTVEMPEPVFWGMFRQSTQEVLDVIAAQKKYEVLLTFELDDGKHTPAEGMKLLPAKSITVGRDSFTADSQGRIPLSLPGSLMDFECQLQMPWGEMTNWLMWHFEPGRSNKKTLLVPKDAPGAGKLKFQIENPTETPTEAFMFEVEIQGPARRVDGIEWLNSLPSEPFTLLVSPNGDFVRVKELIVGTLTDFQLAPASPFVAGDYSINAIRICQTVPGRDPEGDITVRYLSGRYAPEKESARITVNREQTTEYKIVLPELIWKRAIELHSTPTGGGGFF